MTSTAVDPAILRVVGDVGRPERGVDDPVEARHEFKPLGSVSGDIELIVEVV